MKMIYGLTWNAVLNEEEADLVLKRLPKEWSEKPTDNSPETVYFAGGPEVADLVKQARADGEVEEEKEADEVAPAKTPVPPKPTKRGK